MVVVALGEPGTPVVCCAIAGTKVITVNAAAESVSAAVFIDPFSSTYTDKCAPPDAFAVVSNRIRSSHKPRCAFGHTFPSEIALVPGVRTGAKLNREPAIANGKCQKLTRGWLTRDVHVRGAVAATPLMRSLTGSHTVGV